MNVPASTSALPSSNSFGASRSGRIAYLSGPKNAASTPMTQRMARSAVVLRARTPRGGSQHQRDPAELDQPDQPGLVVLVGELARRRRAQKERQDEQAAGERDQDLRRHLPGGVGAVGDHQHQRVLDRVVVERRQKLRPEQRPEPPRGKQRHRPRRRAGCTANRNHGCCFARSPIKGEMEYRKSRKCTTSRI